MSKPRSSQRVNNPRNPTRRQAIKYLLGAATGLTWSGCASNSGIKKTASSDVPLLGHLTIQMENLKPGTTAWKITAPAIYHEIEGYASATSVNRGQDIGLFVSTVAGFYFIEVFRMGWYGGAGARQMMPPALRLGKLQPKPTPNPETGLMECQWDDPYVLHIPSTPDPTDWASGVYLAKLTAGTSGKQCYIIFVVRDDERSSDLLFQSSVTTFQAYNDWHGLSLYTSPRAYMVSFNRPYQRLFGSGDFFQWEYNMVRFLERESYDVTYSTDVDTHTHGNMLSLHKGFLSVGHDEYWSWEMRKNVERARDMGVNLGFFGSNTCYWQIRFLPSFITNDEDRTMVCYKNAALDPIANSSTLKYLTTTQFRLPPVNYPEDALVGVMYEGIFNNQQDVIITDASHWVWQNTGLADGDRLSGLLGNEADRMFGDAPLSTQRIAQSPYVDMYGQPHSSDMTVYPTDSTGTVVATGSMRWNWGLDDFTLKHPVLTDPAVQQATRNILGRFSAVDQNEQEMSNLQKSETL